MRRPQSNVSYLSLAVLALLIAIFAFITEQRVLWLVVFTTGCLCLALSIRDSRRIRRHLRGRAPLTHCPMCGKAMSDGQEATLQHMVEVHNARVETRPVDCDDPTHDHYGKHIALIRMPMPSRPAEPAKQWTEDDL